MELITILNRCHRFPRFVYQEAQFGPNKRSIEISVRPRKVRQHCCQDRHQIGLADLQ